MSRKPDGAELKRVYGVALTPSLVSQLKAEAHVGNLSAWIDEKIRQEVVGLVENNVIFACDCGAEASMNAWKGWEWKCVSCQKVYENGGGLRKIYPTPARSATPHHKSKPFSWPW